MLIYFKTHKLQNICNKENEAIKKLGLKMARKLQQRLMELSAAPCLDDISKLPPARCHQLTGNRTGQFSVDLDQPYRLIFIPTNNPIPEKKDGGLDLAKIDSIEILTIVDTQ
jgi:plasmid maintenance system killer protein